MKIQKNILIFFVLIGSLSFVQASDKKYLSGATHQRSNVSEMDECEMCKELLQQDLVLREIIFKRAAELEEAQNSLTELQKLQTHQNAIIEGMDFNINQKRARIERQQIQCTFLSVSLGLSIATHMYYWMNYTNQYNKFE